MGEQRYFYDQLYRIISRNMRDNEYEMAIRHIEELYSIPYKGEYDNWENVYAICLLKLDRLDEAMEKIDAELERDGNDRAYKSWIIKGQIFKELGDYEETIACFERAMEFEDKQGYIESEIIETFQSARVCEYLLDNFLAGAVEPEDEINDAD